MGSALAVELAGKKRENVLMYFRHAAVRVRALCSGLLSQLCSPPQLGCGPTRRPPSWPALRGGCSPWSSCEPWSSVWALGSCCHRCWVGSRAGPVRARMLPAVGPTQESPEHTPSSRPAGPQVLCFLLSHRPLCSPKFETMCVWTVLSVVPWGDALRTRGPLHWTSRPGPAEEGLLE